MIHLSRWLTPFGLSVRLPSAVMCLLLPLSAATLLADESTVRGPKGTAAPPGPVEARESLKYFQLHPDLRIELAASEPQVMDPVAVRFDELGRMWVVEMRDYPHGPAEGQEPKSQIKILEDTDGDGYFETAHVFADRLLFPTGLQPWQGGVFVTLAGKIVYMRDTDGDQRADQVETWFQGFAEENSQLRANHPTLALDNHIHVANGLRGGAVVDSRNPEAPPVSLSGRDFCFDPRTREFETTSGIGQFGLTFDDFGNRFVCSNRNPVKHIVLEERYIRRNPSVAVATAFHDVAASGAESRVFPICESWTTSNLHAGQFTAACGVHLYRGRALPEAFHGNAFTCEPTGSLVHREVVRADGATFTSSPGRDGIEMLASTDEWFRPVNLEMGPGDELYVVDMYRAVIEHPDFMPAELKRRPDLLDGTDRGRIYRIVAKDAPARTAQPKMESATTDDLVQLLGGGPEGTSSVWVRDTASRLLLERRDRQATDSLVALAREAKAPAVRVRALWLLEGLGELKADLVQLFLYDDDPRVRAQAVRLAETWLRENADLRQAVRRLAEHENARLRFQVALSLSPVKERADVEALSAIARLGRDDPWTRQAVTIAAGPMAPALGAGVLADISARNDELSDADLSLVRALVPGVAGSTDQQQREFADSLTVGLAAARSRRLARVALHAWIQANARARKDYRSLLNGDLTIRVERIFADAERVAADRDQPLAQRLEAIDLLAFSQGDPKILVALATRDSQPPIRLQAIGTLAQQSGVEPWPTLLARFREETPAVRGAILDGVLASRDRILLLLDAMERGDFKATELDRVRTDRLLRSRDAQIQKRVQEILADAIPADRQQVLRQYQSALELASDARRGLEVFRKQCATCHRVGDVGVNVGPDISDSRTKQPIQILTDILQPNRAIDGNYVSYSALTVDSRVVTGILSSETASSVTLTEPEGKTSTLLRDEIEEIRSNGISLMPEGLEKNIPQQDMADLIAYIKNWRYLDGRTPLGE